MKPSWPPVGCTVGNLCNLEIWPVSCQRVNLDTHQFSDTEHCRAGFCWENWRDGDASGLQCVHHSHKQVFGLQDWAIAGMYVPSRMGIMPFTPTVLLYGPAPIHLCYLLINAKPHWRVLPFQLPAGPPQPLLCVFIYLSSTNQRCLVAGSLKLSVSRMKRKFLFCQELNVVVGTTKSTVCCSSAQESTGQDWGKMLIILVLMRVWENIIFLAIWQEATDFFQNTFPTPSSLSLFREVSRSFWGEVGQFRKNTNTTDSWHLKLNSCAKVAQ